MDISAKVICSSKVDRGEGEQREVAVSFAPDYAAGRNKEWALYTPQLALTMTLRGTVADHFTTGKCYTLTFTQTQER